VHISLSGHFAEKPGYAPAACRASFLVASLLAGREGLSSVGSCIGCSAVIPTRATEPHRGMGWRQSKNFKVLSAS
jgi:hypothetical protein